MLCGRFYMPLLLVTVARGPTGPGTASICTHQSTFEMEDNYEIIRSILKKTQSYTIFL